MNLQEADSSLQRPLLPEHVRPPYRVFPGNVPLAAATGRRRRWRVAAGREAVKDSVGRGDNILKA